MSDDKKELNGGGKWPRALFLLLFSLLFILFFAGCIQVSVREQFYPNGRATVLQQIYVGSAVRTLAAAGIPSPESFGSSESGWYAYLDSVCANVSSQEPGAYCQRLNDWLVFDQVRVSGTDYSFTSYESFPYTVYDLRVFRMPMPPLQQLEQMQIDHPPIEREFANTSLPALSQLKSAGMQYSYLLAMPGEITDYNSGHLTEAGLEVDVLAQMASRTPLRVHSRQLNLPQLALLVIIGLDLLLLLDVVVIWVVREWTRRRKEVERRRKIEEEEESKKRVFPKSKKLRGYEVYKVDEENLASETNIDLPPLEDDDTSNF